MLRQLLRKLSRRRDAGVELEIESESEEHVDDAIYAEDTGEGGQPACSGAEETSSDSATTSQVSAPLSMKDRIKNDLSCRLADLQDKYSDVSEGTDIVALLDMLEDAENNVVRQPPLAAQRVLAVSRNPDAGLNDLVGLLERDPTLTQGLLRYANSAFYAGISSEPVVALMTAVQRVGMAGVEAVVLRSIAEGLISRPGPPFDRLVGKVWSHMVRCAPIARSIAPAFGVEPDRAFTLGLLHDAGKLVILDRVSTLRSNLRRAPELPTAFLSATLSGLHQTLGALAAAEWGLGDETVAAIANHHRNPVPEIDSTMCEVVYVAEQVDLARQKNEELVLAELWKAGQLTGSIESTSEAIEAELSQAA